MINLKINKKLISQTIRTEAEKISAWDRSAHDDDYGSESPNAVFLDSVNFLRRTSFLKYTHTHRFIQQKSVSANQCEPKT